MSQEGTSTHKNRPLPLPEGLNIEQPATGGQANVAVVNYVFSMFKDYLGNKIDEKGKEIEQKNKIDNNTAGYFYESVFIFSREIFYSC